MHFAARAYSVLHTLADATRLATLAFRLRLGGGRYCRCRFIEFADRQIGANLLLIAVAADDRNEIGIARSWLVMTE